jgi:hypothetical protein
MKIKSRYLSLLFIVLIAFACKSLKSQGNSLQVSVKNNTNNNKVAETVEINWEKLSMFKNVKQEKIIVKSASTGVEIPSQIIYHGQKSPKAIILEKYPNVLMILLGKTIKSHLECMERL